MSKGNPATVWAQQIRAPFLILSVVLVLIPTAVACHLDAVLHIPQILLLAAGVILTHTAVNLFNELSDYQTGIDSHTTRTPFSGGSGMMQGNRTTPGQVKTVAYSTLMAGGAVGLYFCWVSGWPVLIFMAIGAAAIRFYTSHLARWLMGEIVAGLALGSLVVLGGYYALTSSLNLQIVLVSIPPGLLTFQLLFLNEFPDLEADREGKRHHLLIHFGRRICARIYALVMAFTYLAILLIPLLTPAPPSVLLGLLTLPVALKASIIAIKHHDDLPRLVPAMGMNVVVVLLTDALLALGYFIA